MGDMAYIEERTQGIKPQMQESFLSGGKATGTSMDSGNQRL